MSLYRFRQSQGIKGPDRDPKAGRDDRRGFGTYFVRHLVDFIDTLPVDVKCTVIVPVTSM